MFTDENTPVSRPDLSALIASLQASERGSREWSDTVLLSIGWTHKGSPAGLWFLPSGGAWKKQRPSPTEDVDVALRLIPDGWLLTHAYQRPQWTWVLTNHQERKYAEGKAQTAALALCIAALKSRQA